VSGRSNGVTDAAPVRLFRSRNDWAAWLEKNHRNSDGLWLRLAKKASAIGDSRRSARSGSVLRMD